MDRVRLRGVFNQFAGNKVVKSAEFKANLKTLFKSNLTLPQKIYLKTLDPLCTIFGAIALGFHAVLKHETPLAGARRDEAGGLYMNANNLREMFRTDLRHALSKTACLRTWELGGQAFQQCENRRSSVEYVAGKPVVNPN